MNKAVLTSLQSRSSDTPFASKAAKLIFDELPLGSSNKVFNSLSFSLIAFISFTVAGSFVPNKLDATFAFTLDFTTD
ncbi:MAG: hypothetical protein QM734_05715 [Cyclobacteriaceae bacterium]